jgi:transketolase
MSDDIHDQLMQTVLDYHKASEEFETRPSFRNTRTIRRELRKLITLCRQRQDEAQDAFNKHLEEYHKKYPKKRPKAKSNGT